MLCPTHTELNEICASLCDWPLLGRLGFGGSIPGGGSEFSSSPPHPASYPTFGGALSLRVKCLEREADRSPPPSAEVKNA
jgi:hypothetical protein